MAKGGWDDPNFITSLDLGVAYRKAKADLYYERDHPMLFAICEYEQNLESNLTNLFGKLQSGDLSWMTNAGFVGGWSVIPENLQPEKADEPVAWRPSDPDELWEATVREHADPPTANFRVVGVHSIDFHVTSSLWMLKVGHLYDAALGKEAYGSRLRRYRPERTHEPGQVNRHSLGSFQPYFRPFGRWRDNGLRVMRQALEDQKRIVAITADVRQFYHRISPDFLLEPDYLNVVDLSTVLGADEWRFTEALKAAFHAWAARTPIHASDPSVGIPVGLPAARLVANVALAELDQLITREVMPLHYGRYVDDIMLVFEDNHRFKSGVEVWKHIARRVGPALRVRTRGELEVHFTRPYLGKSQVVLAGKKQKVFLLEGSAGMALVGSIERQVRSRASQWRALPDLPDTPVGLSADVVAACGDDGEEVDNLRRAEALSVRRAALAIRLRNSEAFDHDLPPDQWRAQRQAFLQVTRKHLVALPKLFDFAPYLRRLFALAVACRDYDEASRFVDRLDEVTERIATDCTVRLAADPKSRRIDRILNRWRDHIGRALAEALVSALTHAHLDDAEEVDELLDKLRAFVREWQLPFEDAAAAFDWSRWFFVHDLARVPYRMRYFPYGHARSWPSDAIPADQISLSGDSHFYDEKQFVRVMGFLQAVEDSGQSRGVPIALAYPTRPLSIPEIYFLVPGLLEAGEKKRIADWTLAFRGFHPGVTLPGADRKGGPVAIPKERNHAMVHVALTSWSTTIESWKAAVTALPDPDRDRYTRLNRMLNDVLRTRERVDYLVLPELAIPQRWFFRLSDKLAARGISLIAGVEYLHHGSDSVANQVWCSLVSDFLDFPSTVVYRQDKGRPALEEEKALWQTAGKRLVPLRAPSKPVIQHGGLHFGVLICSELTNLQYRERVRGKVDALFVPEWNRDTETFSALVEASALDVHAYVIQCNDRVFGDSRIRSPAKASWSRDIVRVKGGIEDYFVIGAIDVSGLRRFQSANRSPDEPFKPVPDGFEIDAARRRLP